MDYVDDFIFDGVYVLIGEDGSVADNDGRPMLQYVWGKIWVNNHAHVLTGKNGVSTDLLLLFLKSIKISPFITGAVQPKLNQANLCRIPLLLPNESVSKTFSQQIEPLFAKIRANAEESRKLTQARDLILPRMLNEETD